MNFAEWRKSVDADFRESNRMSENVEPRSKFIILTKLEQEFGFICDGFLDIFKKLSPPSKLREGFAVSLNEEDKISVDFKFRMIQSRLDAVRQLMSEWDRIENDSSLAFNLKEANSIIKTVGLFVQTVNSLVENESWFNSRQGDGNTSYRMTQIAYKDFMEAVREFFKRTNKESEKSKGISKSPEAENLLNQKALEPPP